MIRALAEIEADTCTGCGHPISEAWDPTGDRMNLWSGTHYYQPEMHRCFACTELDQAKRAVDTASPTAVHWLSARVDRRAPMGHMAVTD